jgi:hypothetical protein
MTWRLISLRPYALAAVATGVVLLSGCGRDGVKLYPVTGKVLVNGNPAANAMVVFHPVGAVAADAVRPRATVGSDGSFTLTTHQAGDGAPPGEYRVTVELWLSSGKGDESPTSRLPAVYARPESSGLSATVNAGPTELQPFNLKSRDVKR